MQTINWMTPQETAAQVLRDESKTKTLEYWRQAGIGPKFVKAGRRVLYRRDWNDEWLESRAVTSTAEARRSGLI